MPGGVRAWAVAAQVACTGRRPDSGLRGQGTSGAHREYEVYACDLGGVEADERLVEGQSVLPSRKERI